MIKCHIYNVRHYNFDRYIYHDRVRRSPFFFAAGSKGQAEYQISSRIISSEVKRWSSGMRMLAPCLSRAPSLKRASTTVLSVNEYNSVVSKPLSVRRESMILSTLMSSGERVSEVLEYVAEEPSGLLCGSSWLFQERTLPVREWAPGPRPMYGARRQ